jgi:hypothetical protein
MSSSRPPTWAPIIGGTQIHPSAPSPADLVGSPDSLFLLFPLPRALIVSHGLELGLPAPPAKSSLKSGAATVTSATDRRPSSLRCPRLCARPEDELPLPPHPRPAGGRAPSAASAATGWRWSYLPRRPWRPQARSAGAAHAATGELYGPTGCRSSTPAPRAVGAAGARAPGRTRPPPCLARVEADLELGKKSGGVPVLGTNRGERGVRERIYEPLTSRSHTSDENRGIKVGVVAGVEHKNEAPEK